MAKHPHARAHARKHALSSAVPHRCVICGYQTIVEVAHIKALSEFPEGTSTRVINSDFNLTYLCPTHHAEWDGGYMEKAPPSIGELLKKMQVPVTTPPPKPIHKRRYSTGRKAV